MRRCWPSRAHLQVSRFIIFSMVPLAVPQCVALGYRRCSTGHAVAFSWRRPRSVYTVYRRHSGLPQAGVGSIRVVCLPLCRAGTVSRCSFALNTFHSAKYSRGFEPCACCLSCSEHVPAFHISSAHYVCAGDLRRRRASHVSLPVVLLCPVLCLSAGNHPVDSMSRLVVG